MSLDFTAIDFETANSDRASACAVGVAVVENGEIRHVDSCLIKPKKMKFDAINIGIHGIRPHMVQNEPEFEEVWNKWLLPAIPSGVIVAHNASFDTSVLRKSFCEYSLVSPELDYFCTVRMAKSHLPDLPAHSLMDVVDALGLGSFKHHQAIADARAAAHVALAICQQLNVDSLEDALDKLKINPGKMWHGGWQSCGKSKCKHSYDVSHIAVPEPESAAVEEKIQAEPCNFSLGQKDLATLVELKGVAEGILADGRVVKSEVEFLLDWLSRLPASHSLDWDVLVELKKVIRDILADDVLDQYEEHYLTEVLNGLSDRWVVK